MKNIINLCILTFLLAGCNYTVYDMNKGLLTIPKKDSYLVKYSVDIPAGAKARISYTDKDKAMQTVEAASGKWEKEVTLPSGQEVMLTVDVKLPQTDPASRLTTIQTVDGIVVDEKVQTGKKVMYRFGYKLP
nr:MmpS family transport accessory protein [uncultured Mucilaginibacter sp.]